jgi:hypothetical protein
MILIGPKRVLLMTALDLDKIPKELTARPQWVCWRPDKKPVDPKTGGNAKANDPATWGEFTQALKHHQAHQSNDVAGVGFEFSQADPYVGIDLDNCRNPETRELRYCAHVLLDYLASYSEASPSGTGIHAITKAKWPRDAGHKKAMPCGMKIEVYDALRYFTMTGAHLAGTPTTIEPRQAELEALHHELFAKPKVTPWDPGPSPALGLSDQELIDKAHQATNGEKFGKLWVGDISEYGNDDSAADYALCLMLAFWTSKDRERIDRLFQKSGLMRDKWNRPTAGSTYGAITIRKAISQTTETFNSGQRSQELQQGQDKRQADPTKQERKAPTFKTITARELAKLEFAPRKWAVPDLITEGLTILAGRPKTGKSWLALNLGVAVAGGGVALGKYQVEKGEVLFLALEDGPRRLKERLAKIVPFGELPGGLIFATVGDFPPLHKGGVEALDSWLKEHPGARLVVIDTLARVKPARKGNQDAYDHDTAIVAGLQRLSIEHQVALVVIHHTRKNIGDDFLEEVSGTFGLTGSADCVAVLARKGRGQMDGVLKLTGRDIEEKELALKFDPHLGLWSLLGEANKYAMSQERQDILLTLRKNGPQTPTQIAEKLDKTPGAIRGLLLKMKEVGEVKPIAGNKYEAGKKW